MSHGDSLWTVALADGWMQTFQVDPAGAVSQVDLLPEQLPPGSPPLLRIDGDVPSLPDGHLIVGGGVLMAC